MGVPPISEASKKPLSPLIFQKPLLGLCLPLLIAMVAFLVYWPSLHSDFVYDARLEILKEGFITSLSNLPAILSLKVLGTNLMLGDRPGQLLYLMLNAAIWGKEPWGYHLSSNLLHAANVALLFILLRRLLATEVTGLAGSEALRVQVALAAVTLIFALHPIATEAVAAVNYSSDLLVTFFTLVALLCAIGFRPEKFRAALIPGALGVCCAFASVTSKESGMATALLLVVYWFLYRRGEAKEPWFWFLGTATALTAVFLAARFYFAPPSPMPLAYLNGSFFQVFLIQPHLWIFMMGKLIWPVHLSADYTPENIGVIHAPQADAVLTVVLLLQGWLAAKSRIGFLGVAVYWLGLATVSNFIPLNRILADRFYYLPLAGVAMQLLALLMMTLKSRLGYWLAVAPLIVAILPLTRLTLAREKIFSNELLLWKDTVQVSPFSPTAQNNYGAALLQDGQVDEGVLHIKKALELVPTYSDSHTNLGFALSKKGRTEEAIAEYQKALDSNPNNADAHSGMGTAFSSKGEVDQAIAEYQKALVINPNDGDTRNLLGNLLLRKGQVDEAMAQFQKAVEIDPHDAEAYNNIGSALSKKGQVDEAIVQYQKALEYDPINALGHHNLGTALLAKGRTDEAIAEYRKAVGFNPKYAQAYADLGSALYLQGKVDEAIAQYESALRIDPYLPPAHTNLGIALAQKGQWAEAVAQFQEVVKLTPNDAKAQDNLAKSKAILQAAQK